MTLEQDEKNAGVNLETEVAKLATAMRGIDSNLRQFVEDTNKAIGQLSANISDVARITQESITSLASENTKRERLLQEQISQGRRTNWPVIFGGASVFLTIIGGFIWLTLSPIYSNQAATLDILKTINERTYGLEREGATLKERVKANNGRFNGMVLGLNSQMGLKDKNLDIRFNAGRALTETKFRSMEAKIEELSSRMDRGFGIITSHFDILSNPPK